MPLKEKFFMNFFITFLMVIKSSGKQQSFQALETKKLWKEA